jgi:small subunit ribosomal protein S17e
VHSQVGRIKTRPVKRTTHELIERYGNEFNSDFSHNKQVVGRLITGGTKKLRNVIAGYATRLVRKKVVDTRPHVESQV